MQLKIEKPTKKDKDVIYETYLDYYNNLFPELDSNRVIPKMVAKLIKNLYQRIFNPNTVTFASFRADFNEKLLAFSTSNVFLQELRIHDILITDPDEIHPQIKRNIYKVFLDYYESIAADLGLENVFFEVNKNDEDLISLIQILGYTPSAEYNSEEHATFIYEKQVRKPAVDFSRKRGKSTSKGK